MALENEFFNQFLNDAKDGNALAQYNVGICYYNGEYVEQNYEKAVSWFTKSAKNGNVYSISQCCSFIKVINRCVIVLFNTLSIVIT